MSLFDGCSIKQITDNDEEKQPTTPVVLTEEEVAIVYQQILWDNHISVVTKQVNAMAHKPNYDAPYIVSMRISTLHSVIFYFSMLWYQS